MQKLNSDVNPLVLNKKDEVISFKCELQENLQKAMKEFVEKHPNWDQYRIIPVSYTHLRAHETAYFEILFALKILQ